MSCCQQDIFNGYKASEARAVGYPGLLTAEGRNLRWRCRCRSSLCMPICTSSRLQRFWPSPTDMRDARWCWILGVWVLQLLFNLRDQNTMQPRDLPKHFKHLRSTIIGYVQLHPRESIQLCNQGGTLHNIAGAYMIMTIQLLWYPTHRTALKSSVTFAFLGLISRWLRIRSVIKSQFERNCRLELHSPLVHSPQLPFSFEKPVNKSNFLGNSSSSWSL